MRQSSPDDGWEGRDSKEWESHWSRPGLPNTSHFSGEAEKSVPRGGEEGVLGDTDAENLEASLSMACVSPEDLTYPIRHKSQ